MGSVVAMETVEGRKRMKFLKSVNGGKVDRISALPDCLLLEILSRLPSIEDAVGTGALSKRWKHLWTSVPTLIFTQWYFIPSQQCHKRKFTSDFVSFVDKTLTQCRQLKLKKFVLYACYENQFEYQFNNWIRYAISRNVEQLDLQFLGDEAELGLDQLIFTASCFTYLTLESCMLNPVVAISWKNMQTLCIRCVKLDEDLIQNILSGSPLLETLEVCGCYGFRRLNITSKSVKKLVFSVYMNGEDEFDFDEIVEINGPYILSLRIEGDLILSKLLLSNVSSVVEATLDYQKIGDDVRTRKEAREELLKGLLLNLRHAKELKIGASCFKALSGLEAKGFIIPSNIKFADADYECYDSDSDM